MTERTITKKSLADSDSDSISLTSTKESDVDEDVAYVVDRILAEAEDDDGEKSYLIRWEGYDLLKSTWEPAENIQMHETFSDWEAEKARIKRGDSRPFDISDYNRRLREQIHAKEERHKRRRAKRRRRGIPISLSGSDSEEYLDTRNKDDARASDRVITAQKQADHNSGVPSTVEHSAPKTSSPKNLDTNHDESDISEDSLLEELVQKALRRPRVGVLKETGKKLSRERNSAKVSPPLASPSTHDPPLPNSRNAEALKAGRKVETSSRSGYKGTANRGSSSAGPVSRGRGNTSTRGSMQNRGRGAKTGNVNFTGIKSTAEGAAKQKRSLANAILKAPKSGASNQKEHFKTFSMARKVELGGRALADRAPDIESVGPLRTLSDYSGARLARNRPQESMTDQLKNTSKPELSHRELSPPMDFSTAQALVDQMILDDEDETVLHEDLVTVAKDAGNRRRNSEPGGILSPADAENQNQPSRTKYLETGSTGISNLSGSGSSTPNSMELEATIANLSEWARMDPSAPEQGQSQKLAPTNEMVRAGVAEQPTTQLSPTKAKAQTDRRRPSKSVTKLRLSEYTSRRASDVFGNAMSVQAIFGCKSTHLPIAFAETNKHSEQSWISVLRDIKTISFNKAFLAQDLEPQAKVLNTFFLARGNVLTDSSGALGLEEVAENLRPSVGLSFEHSTFSILVFPARCEEWKFLEIPNADHNAVLRYHVQSQPCAVAPNSISPTVTSLNEHLVFLVELIQGLNYKSLIPRCTEGEDVNNFYLLFPGKASSSANLLATWLRACNPESRIFTNQRPGSWNMFCSSSVVKSGAVIIHAAFVSLISKIPSIERLLSGKASFNFWCFDDGRSESLYSNLGGEGLEMVRLFPHGGAVMLTPSFLHTQPQRTHELLVWFQSKVNTATKGTWKLILPHNCRQYFLDHAVQKIAKGEEINTCKYWFLSYQIVDKLLREENMEGFPYGGVSDAPDEAECSIVYADQSIKHDDEIGLATWYAGWTMLHLNHFRKFIIVGTRRSKDKHERQNAGSSAAPAEVANSSTSVPSKGDAQGASATEAPSADRRGNTFAAVGDSPSNAGQGPFIPTPNTPMNEDRTQKLTAVDRQEQEGIVESSSGDVGGRKHSSRPSHGIDETLNQSILQFIVITGANREEAERFLSAYGGDIDVATRNYFSPPPRASSLPSIPQLDGSPDTDPAPPLDFNTSSEGTSNLDFRYLHLAREDVQRAKELYRAAQEPSISPSWGPGMYDGVDEREVRSQKPLISPPSTVRDGITKRKSVPKTVPPSGPARPNIRVRTGHVAPEDRAVNKNRGVEGGPINTTATQSPVVAETEHDNAEGKGSPRTSSIVNTMEWYKGFKKNHGAWEHIYVGPWDECFKILRVKSKE